MGWAIERDAAIDAPVAAWTRRAAPSEPGLSLEHDGDGRLRLRAGGVARMWARRAPRYAGVWVLRRRSTASLGVTPPISARLARAKTDLGAWLTWTAAALEQSEVSPLTAGTWRLEVASLAGCEAALEVPRLRFEAWGPSGSGAILPLRDPSPPDAGRVKSWRKHARAGTLPPLLLWWVSALDVHLLLDGHDRLRAASLEGVSPTALTLARVDEMTSDPEWREALRQRYARVFDEEPRLALPTRERLGRQLAEAHAPWRVASTVARHRPMTAAWREEVRAELGEEEARPLLSAPEAPAPRR